MSDFNLVKNSALSIENAFKNMDDESRESFYKTAVSNIGVQLGFQLSKEMDEEAILTKATQEVFFIWKQDGYTNFYDREAKLAEQNKVVTEEAPDLS